MEKFNEGDKVYAYDVDGIHYGVLHRNLEFPDVSEWYVAYEDGEECAVLDIELVHKVGGTVEK